MPRSATYCPFVKAVIWGAPDLRHGLAVSGVLAAEQCEAQVALVRIDGERDLEFVRHVREQCPNLPVVVMLEMRPDRAGLALRAVELGAMGLIANDTPLREVATALEEVKEGRAFIATSGAELLVLAVRTRAQTRASFALTPRERDVLAELARGKTVPQIAGDLAIGQGTVQTHLKSLYRKLDVSSKAAATAIAFKYQLI